MLAIRLFYVLAFLSSSKLCLGHDGYSYPTSKHHLKWNGKCAMVPLELDYKSGRGKTYQNAYESYFAFYTCKGRSCDKTVMHAIRMDDYFRSTSSCVQDYCDQCNGEHCTSDCRNYVKMTSMSDDGKRTYNGCTAITSIEGLRYYYGPKCTIDGHVTMGYYFDKHCQINATRRRGIISTESFTSLDVFGFVQSICSNCNYFEACQGIYNSSFACMEGNGTFLWAGSNINLIDAVSADGYNYKSRREENFNDGDDEYELEKEEKIRTETFQTATKICIEVNSVKHLQEKSIRNITAYYIRELGIMLMDLFIMAGIVAVTAGIAFLVVAHSYYARHHAPWAQESVVTLNYCDSESEVTDTSRRDCISVDE
ncbi:hypothetical protein HJC23_001042 [Cyclotella cryptica]|uniref:Uncharacterized protein n=1 Tax=Cyclotella cryptica TaxID=29204 RepID=A0ABD3QKP2_9STRA|eukprot:CCRYP_004997-RA/>CCRYP_004997-RA protein AED:0.00 eAED:0.00 QI:309/1/1/1/1/1/2/39/367